MPRDSSQAVVAAQAASARASGSSWRRAASSSAPTASRSASVSRSSRVRVRWWTGSLRVSSYRPDTWGSSGSRSTAAAWWSRVQGSPASAQARRAAVRNCGGCSGPIAPAARGPLPSGSNSTRAVSSSARTPGSGSASSRSRRAGTARAAPAAPVHPAAQAAAWRTLGLSSVSEAMSSGSSATTARRQATSSLSPARPSLGPVSSRGSAPHVGRGSAPPSAMPPSSRSTSAARMPAAAVRARNGTAFADASYTDPWCRMLPYSSLCASSAAPSSSPARARRWPGTSSALP